MSNRAAALAGTLPDHRSRSSLNSSNMGGTVPKVSSCRPLHEGYKVIVQYVAPGIDHRHLVYEGEPPPKPYIANLDSPCPSCSSVTTNNSYLRTNTSDYSSSIISGRSSVLGTRESIGSTRSSRTLQNDPSTVSSTPNATAESLTHSTVLKPNGSNISINAANDIASAETSPRHDVKKGHKLSASLQGGLNSTPTSPSLRRSSDDKCSERRYSSLPRPIPAHSRIGTNQSNDSGSHSDSEIHDDPLLKADTGMNGGLRNKLFNVFLGGHSRRSSTEGSRSSLSSASSDQSHDNEPDITQIVQESEEYLKDEVFNQIQQLTKDIEEVGSKDILVSPKTEVPKDNKLPEKETYDNVIVDESQNSCSKEHSSSGLKLPTVNVDTTMLHNEVDNPQPDALPSNNDSGLSQDASTQDEGDKTPINELVFPEIDDTPKPEESSSLHRDISETELYNKVSEDQPKPKKKKKIKFKQKPVVLLFGWLNAPDRALIKYCNLYHERGHDVIIIKGAINQFLLPSVARTTARHLLTYVAKRLSKNQPLMVHAFSIGAYLFTVCMIELKENTKRYGRLLRHRFVGQVFDSIVIGGTERMVRAGSIAASDSYLGRLLVRLIFRSYLSLTSKYTLEFFDQAVEVFKSNYLNQPTLIFYSLDDPMSCPQAIQELIDLWKKNGFEVQAKYWPSSPHAAHLQAYPEQYKIILEAFMISKLEV
ncbi:unnamed protein product [Owenia fusiformis]|uniref:Uncharacterized protein n=1 Tax=Owenia fusiformis TaxID=6347 RepID=A0A8J1TWS1_OWEFU|nr:unnamed protein product [Owenia fusiformis]